MKHNIIAILLSTLTLSTCAKSNDAKQNASHSQTKEITAIAQLDPELQKKVQSLLDKTQKELIFVKGGSFMMGDFGLQHSKDGLPYDGDGDAVPLHKVTLSDYKLSASKATYADFDIYTAVNNKQLVGHTDERSIEERVPTAAAGINWQQGRDYCQWLGKQLNLKMDLPTEAQWEYAARNRGQMIMYPTNNGKLENGKNIWSFEQRQKAKNKYKTIVVVPELKQFHPTPMGFYDMVTDNYEWMLDWYDPDYYRKSPEHNPQGPSIGTKKVVRSTAPDDGQNIKMSGGLTISRHAIDPVADPELVKGFANSKYSIDYNIENSVRCAANL
ncbi:formylglycine-generating enzyme family protein [Acinetobacter nematophilus]|uniref:formylglycine-generating enzyme family protein n=1 Tax=Acinetobacter nematophilus TaxID=2994642 RepID=UPI003AF94E4D